MVKRSGSTGRRDTRSQMRVPLVASKRRNGRFLSAWPGVNKSCDAQSRGDRCADARYPGTKSILETGERLRAVDGRISGGWRAGWALSCPFASPILKKRKTLKVLEGFLNLRELRDAWSPRGSRIPASRHGRHVPEVSAMRSGRIECAVPEGSMGRSERVDAGSCCVETPCN